MPFRALVDNKVVSPSQVDDHQAVQCPDCGGVLYPRDGDSRARHFYHAVDEDAESCATAVGGESETHARCTALAAAELSARFSDPTRLGVEIPLDVAGTKTTPDTRRADALVEFQESNAYFGNGLIIEVQYKHHSKDIQGTTHDYLSAGFSVAWLTPEDFDNEGLPSTVIDEAFQDDDRRAYNVPEYDPWEFETRVETALTWEPPSLECLHYDETGEHYWHKIPSYGHPNGYEYEFCPDCGIRRQYDNQIGRFVYDHDGVLTPDIRLNDVRDAVIPYLERVDDVFYELKANKQYGGPVEFEKALAWRTDVAPCRGPQGVHEWDRKEVIERKYDDNLVVSLWECRYCPVHLLTNFSGNGETEPYILFGEVPDPDWGLSHLNGNPRFCQFRAHKDDQDWDYCSICFQLNP